MQWIQLTDIIPKYATILLKISFIHLCVLVTREAKLNSQGRVESTCNTALKVGQNIFKITL